MSDADAAIAAQLNDEGVAFGEVGDDASALARYDEVEQRFGSADHPAVVAQVARALVNAALVIDDPAVSLPLFDDAVQRFGDHVDVGVRAVVARGMRQRTRMLLHLDRSSDAARAAVDVITRFGVEGDPAIRLQVALSRRDKSRALWRIGNRAAAKAAFDTITELYGTDDDLIATHRLVAEILCGIGNDALELRRGETAIVAYLDVIGRYTASPDVELRRHVATAMANQAGALWALDRHEEARSLIADVLARFDPSESPTIAEILRRAGVVAQHWSENEPVSADLTSPPPEHLAELVFRPVVGDDPPPVLPDLGPPPRLSLKHAWLKARVRSPRRG